MNGGFALFKCKTETLCRSFFPSTTVLCNSLEACEHNCKTSKVYKSVLKRRYKVEIPEYFYSGPRKINIVLSQMRMQFCSLKYDLCRRGCIDSATCHCERDDETLTHFFFDCPSYGLQRDQLMQSISRLVLDKC